MQDPPPHLREKTVARLRAELYRMRRMSEIRESAYPLSARAYVAREIERLEGRNDW